jgi:hypothetical protein
MENSILDKRDLKAGLLKTLKIAKVTLPISHEDHPNSPKQTLIVRAQTNLQ